MTIHLTWLRAAAAAALAVGVGASPAAAQSLPFRNTPQTHPGNAYPGAPYSGAGQSAVPPAATPQGYAAIPQAVYPTTQPGYQVAQPGYAAAHQGYPVAQPQYAPYRPQAPASPRIAAQPYPTTSAHIPGGYTYPAVAQQPNGPTPANGDVLPPPAEEALPQSEEMPSNGERGAPNGVSHAAPVEGYNGYHDSGNGHGYPTTNGYGNGGNGYAPHGCNTPDYGIGHYFDDECADTQWFGGVYFLYMERDNPSYTKFTAEVDTTSLSYPYYPPARTTVLSSDDINFDFVPGIEVRFGSTFTVGGECDSYGHGYGSNGYGYGSGCGGDSCGSCAPANLYAWEFVWWGIDEDDQYAMVENNFPQGPMRLYGLRGHGGLWYDNGGGGRPIDDYYDYQMPIEDDSPPVTGDVRVVRQSVRAYFSAQNLEINFFRFPVCDIACGSGGCANDCYSYDACGGNGGYGGCAPACEPAYGSTFSLAGLCGVRYFRTDDDFEWATQWSRYDGAAWVPVVDELFHEIEVDNNLVGFQLGGIMNYCVACKWNFFLDTKFGFYNNHINKFERLYSSNGSYAYYEETGEGMVVESSKDDIAFLGEMRLGGSYDISCHWRAVLAYRAVALNGVALSTDQLKPEYSNYADTARIDSDGSMVIHGVQLGAECKY